MSKEHTPWRTYRFSIDETSILDSNLKTIAKGMDAEVARTIVKAVNNHDRLVGALDELISLIDRSERTGNTVLLNASKEQAEQLLTELKP